MPEKFKFCDVSAVEIQIRKAFSRVEPPSIDKLLMTGHWERGELSIVFQRLRGRPMSDALILEFKGSLSAFSALGFIYVIWQYMLYSLRHIDSDVTSFVVHRLANIGKEPFGFEEILKTISREQQASICTYISFIANRFADLEFMTDDFDRAREYWCGS